MGLHPTFCATTAVTNTLSIPHVDCVTDPEFERMLKHVRPEEIPPAQDVLCAEQLKAHLASTQTEPFTLLAVGDVMMGARAYRSVRERGADYLFSGAMPLLAQSELVFANLEAPFARQAHKLDRNHSYRVKPELAAALGRARIQVVSLANNHLLDCGRGGVVETLAALAAAGIATTGAGINDAAAHAPSIQNLGGRRIGLLSYYWNQRCAATPDLPGSATDRNEQLRSDISRLRASVDRLVVSFHWGVPYQREPFAADRAKAHLAIDCGADVVIGHHPHIIQPLEIYRDRAIFYSVGNFMMGTGNSKAEGIAVGIRFDEDRTSLAVFPLYVKNRDPRVNYQTKVLGGRSAENVLKHLTPPGSLGDRRLSIADGIARIELTRPGEKFRGGVSDA